MNKIFKKTVCVILSAVLFAATTVYAVKPVTAASGTINYVSLGDSYSYGQGLVNGDSGSFSSLFKDKLKNQGYTVNYTQLAYSGMRPADIYYILDPEAQRDSYAEDILSNVTADKNTFVNAITNADIITLNIGYANLGNYIKRRLPYEGLGLTDLYSGTCDTDSLISLLNKFDDAVNVDDLKTQISELMVALDGDDIIGYIYGKNNNALTVDAFSEIILQSYISFATYYKFLTDKIYELNPDVELIVLGVKNVTEGLKVTCGSTTYNADKVFNALANLENLYMASFTDKEKYYFVDVNANVTVTTFTDELIAFNSSKDLSKISKGYVNRIIETSFSDEKILGINFNEKIQTVINLIDSANAKIKVGDTLNNRLIFGGINSTMVSLLNNPSTCITESNVKQAFKNVCYSGSYNITRMNTMYGYMLDLVEYLSNNPEVIDKFSSVTGISGILSLLSDEQVKTVKNKLGKLVAKSEMNITSDEFLVLICSALIRFIANSVSIDSVNSDNIINTMNDFDGKCETLVENLFFEEVHYQYTPALTAEQKNGGLSIVDLFTRYYYADGISAHPNADGNTQIANAVYNAHTSASSRTDSDGLTQNISNKDGSSIKDILVKYPFKLLALGDVNADGSVNILDVIELKKNGSTYKYKYDISKDGNLTDDDLMQLMETVLAFN